MANDSESNSVLGEWADADFAGTINRHHGVGADDDLPDRTRFVAGVVRILLRRTAEAEARSEADEADIAIFVLSPSPPVAAGDTKREPMLDNGLTPVTGRLWFTGAAAISGRYANLPGRDDDARFAYVVDTLGLGACPALVFDPRPSAPELRWYSEGLGQPDKRELKALAAKVDASEVFEVVDHVYRECLVTPDALSPVGTPWADARKHLPRSEAEAVIQWNLKVGLAGAFPSCTVRHEQPQQAGRTDLEIEEYDALDRSIVTRHAILELKVLRSFWASGSIVSDGETNEWIDGGVTQAAAYRTTKGARWSALCCFDMRQNDHGDDVCFDHVRDTASRLDVALRRWFLFANAEHYRQAITS